MRLFVLLLAAKASGLAVRLNKLLPGLSRRKADAAIADGRVTVDGVVADGRTPVERGSEVCLDGEPQVWEAREAAKADLTSSDAFLYLKYWKPAGVTCTSDRDDASNVIVRGGFEFCLPLPLLPLASTATSASFLLEEEKDEHRFRKTIETVVASSQLLPSFPRAQHSRLFFLLFQFFVFSMY